jgi:hypothetical protein
MTAQPDSRAALQELLRTIEEADADYLGDLPPEQLAVGHRALMHLLGAGLDMFFDTDADEPVFRRAHWAGRKFFGDNADCIYYAAQIRPDRTYRIRGNVAGAAYTSFTVDGGGIDERYPPARVVSSIHDGQFDVAPDGSYELVASAEPQERNWLALEPDAAEITTRHYFERVEPVAADPLLHIPLAIDTEGPPPAPPSPSDTAASVARDIHRLSVFVRGLTIGTGRRAGERPPPAPGATVNEFNLPTKWSAGSYGAPDIVNMITRYDLAPDDALVIDGRFPRCRFASVALWNSYLQTLDYVHHQVSRNRAQTELNADGSFAMVVSERDPGVANWIETTGERWGTIFVRYILPEEEPEPLRTRVVPVESLRA